MKKPRRASVSFATEEQVEELDRYEKIQASPRAAMPVGSFRQSTVSAHKTIASRRVGKTFSLNHGGMHRRRNKRGN